MLKNILKIIIIFILGIGGGIFADQILWPYFVEKPLFYEYNLEPAPVFVTQKKEITIQENTALQNAVEQVEKAVVGIKTELKTGEILEGSGFIVTSDGLMVTLAELVPQGADFTLFVNGKVPEYQVEKRDLEKNLALISIKESNLKTCGFAELEKLRLGERVFLVGVVFKEANLLKIVNQGIVKFFSKDSIQTNIFEKNILKGSPLFDIEGKVLGLNTIDSEGRIVAIPVQKIRNFAFPD